MKFKENICFLKDSPPVCLSCYCLVDGGPDGPRCSKCLWPLCPDCSNNNSNFHSKNECEIFTKSASIFQSTAENSMDGCIQLHCITPLRYNQFFKISNFFHN